MLSVPCYTHSFAHPTPLAPPSLQPYLRPTATYHILTILAVNRVFCQEKYLRFLIDLKRNKRISFQIIWKRSMRRLHGWMKRHFIEVFQTIPICPNSLFKLPTALCVEHKRMAARYWWANKPWRELCKAKWNRWPGYRILGILTKRCSRNECGVFSNSPSRLLAGCFAQNIHLITHCD